MYNSDGKCNSVVSIFSCQRREKLISTLLMEGGCITDAANATCLSYRKLFFLLNFTHRDLPVHERVLGDPLGMLVEPADEVGVTAVSQHLAHHHRRVRVPCSTWSDMLQLVVTLLCSAWSNMLQIVDRLFGIMWSFKSQTVIRVPCSLE